MPQSNELRVFISSTFRDLQEEREHLVKKIFPEIRSLCRERGVTFTEVDLRWGLTEEEATLGRIIRTCLEEVDKCRPYFIGIIGNRYGWVPELHEILMDPELLAKYPWVEDLAIEGTSVTEMEFIHGVFNESAVEGDCAFFYHKSGDVQDADDSERLRSLIDRVRSTGRPYREFDTADNLGAEVRRSLITMIDFYWPEGEAPSPLELECRSHMAYAASRRRAYIPNPSHRNVFTCWLDKGSTPLVVGGDSGLGKSSLVAYLVEYYRRSRPNALVVEYYVGASQTSGTPFSIIRYLIESIRERFGIEEPMPTTAEEHFASLPNWLLRAEHLADQIGTSVLIIIDAVHQLDEAGRRMAWLPKTIPPGVKLIISSSPGEAFERLSEREWERLDVLPIDDDNVRRSIVVRYLGEFRKGISPQRLQRVTSDVKASSPLYLRVVAEELRLHGEHETLDAMIDRCVMARDLLALFQVVLERIERDFGAGLVRDILTAIGASRSGLSETEILNVTGISRLDLSRLLFAFDYHLIHRDGLVGFFHDFLRRAVGDRYMPTDEMMRARHARLGLFFSGQPFDSRRRDEEPWQWRQAGEHERLCSSIGAIDMLRLLCNDEKQYELLGYWLALGESYDMIDVYKGRLAEWERTHSNQGELLGLLRQLGKFFIAASRLDAAGEMFRRVLTTVTNSEAGDREIALAHEDVGEWQFFKGLYREAGESFSRALWLLERSGQADARELCSLLDSLSSVHYSLAEYDEAERLARRSLRMLEETFGKGHPATANGLHTLGAMISATGNRTEAIMMIRQTIEIRERELGRRHVETNRERYNLGALLHLDGRYDEAVEQYEEALENLRANLGEHPWVASVLYYLGNSMLELTHYPEAEQFLQEALSMQMKLLGAEHPASLNTAVNVAVVRLRSGDASKAAQMLAEVLPRSASAFGWEHPILKKNLETFTEALIAAKLVDPSLLPELQTGESRKTFVRLCRLAGL